jgi:mono/diheme cytochrome c family protein
MATKDTPQGAPKDTSRDTSKDAPKDEQQRPDPNAIFDPDAGDADFAASEFAAMRRENADPDEKVQPLPWFFIMFLGAMGMWGAFYIAATPSGEASAYGDQRTVSLLRPAVVVAGAAPAVDGKQLYGAKCAACHQASGLGVAGVFPPLAGAEWVVGDEKVLISILLHGLQGEIVVKGNTYRGVMPAFGTLADEEIAAVLTYIRGDWGNQAPPVAATAVTAQREATKAQTGPYDGGAALKALAP